MEITRVIEFDLGHRVPNHKGKCRNLHGHRYRLELCVSGIINTADGHHEQGMVTDFGVLKDIGKGWIDTVLDHGMILWEKDPLVLAHGEKWLQEHFGKVVIVSFVPTAEHLAEWLYKQIGGLLCEQGIQIKKVRLYETPNSYADYSVRYGKIYFGSTRE